VSLRNAERLAGVLQALGHQFPVDRPDDADLYESSLRNFYEGMWPVIEPKTPFRGNWHLDAICEHLEYAVVRRQILQLLINMPPRFSKSTLCSVALPANLDDVPAHPLALCLLRAVAVPRATPCSAGA
jgi:hypothetical protein